MNVIRVAAAGLDRCRPLVRDMHQEGLADAASTARRRQFPHSMNPHFDQRFPRSILEHAATPSKAARAIMRHCKPAKHDLSFPRLITFLPQRAEKTPSLSRSSAPSFRIRARAARSSASSELLKILVDPGRQLACRRAQRQFSQFRRGDPAAHRPCQVPAANDRKSHAQGERATQPGAGSPYRSAS